MLTEKEIKEDIFMSTKKDQLERIADALDGGGDYGQGTPSEVGYLHRIADYLEDNPGGGGGGGAESDILVVKVSYDSTTPSNPSHTYAEMLEAYNNGKFIVCKYLMMPEQYGKQAEFLPLYSYYDSSNTFTFVALCFSSTVIKEYRITCNSSNEWTYVQRHTNNIITV